MAVLSVACATLLQSGMSGRAGDTRAEEASEKTTYLACGCGCCSGVKPQSACVADAQALQSKAAEDKQHKDNPQCAMMGCSAGVEYHVCD